MPSPAPNTYIRYAPRNWPGHKLCLPQCSRQQYWRSHTTDHHEREKVVSCVRGSREDGVALELLSQKDPEAVRLALPKDPLVTPLSGIYAAVPWRKSPPSCWTRWCIEGDPRCRLRNEIQTVRLGTPRRNGGPPIFP